MNDGIDALQRTSERIMVAHVAPDQLGSARNAYRFPAMHLVQQCVENTNGVIVLNEFLGDMSANKATAAGDQYASHDNSSRKPALALRTFSQKLCSLSINKDRSGVPSTRWNIAGSSMLEP